MGAYSASKQRWLPKPVLEWSALAPLADKEPEGDEILARITGRFIDWLRAQGAVELLDSKSGIEFVKGNPRYCLSIMHEGVSKGIGFVLESSEPPIPLNQTGFLIIIPAIVFALFATYYVADYLPFMRTNCFVFFAVFLTYMAIILVPTVYALEQHGLLKGLIPKKPRISREEKEARLKFSEEVLNNAMELSRAEGLECRKYQDLGR